MKKLFQKRRLWGVLLSLALTLSLCVSFAYAAPPGGTEGDGAESGMPPGLNIELAEGDNVNLGFDIERATTIIAIVVGAVCVAALCVLIIRIVRNRQVRKVGAAVLCVALAVMLAFNIAVSHFNVVINQFLSSKGTSEEITQAENNSKQLTQELESEGIVLLKNAANTLPLSAKKINVFGYGSNATVYGGAGSGASDESKNVTFQQGMEYAGFEVNQDLVKFYKDRTQKTDTGNVFNMVGNDFNIHEPATSEYENVLDSAKNFSDTAVVVFSRAGGEGGDLPTDMAAYTGGTPGRHYLELSENEEDLLDMVIENFGTVVIVVNSSHAMELGFLETEGVDAAIWIGCPGSTGLNAVGEVLAGKVNPSGRLVDTYAYDATSAPSYYNFGDFSYTNTAHEVTDFMMGGKITEYYKFVDYAEGIYVGYRYYETRWVDNETGECDEAAYRAAVQFPFGYGLSYSTFEQTMDEMKENNGTLSVDVTVTNTGNTPGKEVAQVYYTAPYTVGGIEKSHVVLADFAKTDILEPGQSQTLTLSWNVDDMSSFDYTDAGCYVLDSGNYEIKLMKNAHEVIDSRTYTVDSTITYKDGVKRSSDRVSAVTAFADTAGDVNYVSRADWESTLPSARTPEREASSALVAEIENHAVAENPGAQPIVVKNNGLTLADMVGLDYDDPKWERLIEQLSVNDMNRLISSGGYQTISLASVSKPSTVDIDGPAGLNGLVSGVTGVQFCSETVMAATWNTELVKQMGEALGNEAVANSVTGLYGPGVNIHRSPFSGRNFEYFSEDSTLAGKMAAAEIKGAMSRGCYCYVKHYAVNDQETNRTGVCTWSNEQAVREIYLKPFELAVKEGGTTAVMSSMNRIGAVWTGASRALCTTTLRDEWGFQGMVITDAYMAGTMDISMGIAAGNDMALSITSGNDINNREESNTVQQQMRTACHNILYAVANSNAFLLIDNSAPWWLWLLCAGDIVCLGLITFGIFAVTRKKKAE